jgi:hypothetical protein
MGARLAFLQFQLVGRRQQLPWPRTQADRGERCFDRDRCSAGWLQNNQSGGCGGDETSNVQNHRRQPPNDC